MTLNMTYSKLLNFCINLILKNKILDMSLINNINSIDE